MKATDKAYKVSDFDRLFLLIKVSGSKSWRFKYCLSGKEKVLVIGDYPGISLAQARSARDAARAMVANKTDPSEAKQEKARMEGDAKAQTFAKLAAAFFRSKLPWGSGTGVNSQWKLRAQLGHVWV